MELRMIIKYTGMRTDTFNVKGPHTRKLYEIKDGPGCMIEIDTADWPGFQQKFFEAIRAQVLQTGELLETEQSASSGLEELDKDIKKTKRRRKKRA